MSSVGGDNDKDGNGDGGGVDGCGKALSSPQKLTPSSSSSSSSSSLIPITLKWGKKTFTTPIVSPIQPGSDIRSFQRQIESITQVPVHRQKLLSRGGWKGTLGSTGTGTDISSNNDKTFFPTDLTLTKGKTTLLVTLIGSAEVLIETQLEDRPTFQEDMTEEERLRHEMKSIGIDHESHVHVGDIVALQYERGVDRAFAHRESTSSSSNGGGGATVRTRMSNKGEMVQYNRLVTGLPQWQIEEKLQLRSGSESGSEVAGEVAMTMGLELRRAYVNSLAVLHDGTLVSALDDGHVQLWKRGRLIKDCIHGSGRSGSGGVDHVVSFSPITGNDGGEGPHFATAGMGRIRIWSDDGDAVLDLGMPSGTTPSSLIAGNINITPLDTSDDDNNDNRNSEGVSTSNEEMGNKSFKFLACCCRVTRRSDPNQFRLVPQDEDGRRRRAEAEEQERHIQQSLNNASKCVKFWIYDEKSGSDSLGFGAGTIYPPSNDVAAPVVELAVSSDSHTIVCADAWGGLRIMKWAFEGGYNDRVRGGRRSRPIPKQSEQFQLRCDDDQVDCRISCMQFIENDNNLAVGTDCIQYSVEAHEERSRIIPNTKLLQVTNLRGAVYIINVPRGVIRSVLHAHSDSVQCICPLPSGGLLTAGGKMDATVKVWEEAYVTTALGGGNELQNGVEEDVDSPVVLTGATVMKEPGYVFDLKVLPDQSKKSDGSGGLYAIAAARYNVIKIII